MTGATGFLGTFLVSALTKAGHEVLCPVRGGPPHSSMLERSGAVLLECGRGADALQVLKATGRPDVIYHLASLFMPEHRSEDVEPLVLSNILVGAQVLEAFRHNAPRGFVNVSTSWLHYNDAEYDPVCLYAATKKAFEDIAEYYRVAGSAGVSSTNSSASSVLA